ncbi:MAG: hypothetical protein AB1505_25270 [Candidatus Latescibacterota bacterium]
MADLLIRCQAVERVLCAAAVAGDLGHGGGHRYRAGGRVAGPLRGEALAPDVPTCLRSRWLAACGLPGQRGVRLVPRRQILAQL